MEDDDLIAIEDYEGPYDAYDAFGNLMYDLNPVAPSDSSVIYIGL